MKCLACKTGLKFFTKLPCRDYGNKELYQCPKCYAIYCPEMISWSPEELGSKIYNDEYVKYDPGYITDRPVNYAKMLNEVVVSRYNITHLDYGSGSGIMSRILNETGWHSKVYDPFSSKEVPTEKFNLITAIEVFEHSQDINKTIKDIKKYLQHNGIIIFSTQLANKNTPKDWWYLPPHGGHINISSKESITIHAKRNDMKFASFNENIHILFNNIEDVERLIGYTFI